MQKNYIRKGISLGIVFLFIGGILLPISQSVQKQTQNDLVINDKLTDKSIEKTKITCYTLRKTSNCNQGVVLSNDEASMIYDTLCILKLEMVQHPFSENTQKLKEEFIILLAENNLIPTSITPDQYASLLNPPWFEKLRKNHEMFSSDIPFKPAAAGTAAAFFCSMGGGGVGFLFPFIMLPRPRFVMTWAGFDGEIMVGKLLSIGGFLAEGTQFGIALGYWGIGLAFATPYGTFYGFAGYALFMSATATNLERYPPDYPPEIIDINPEDGAVNVPESLSELSFRIKDPSGDLMSYTVTTTPDIGSGSGNLKPSGNYSIPVEGLQGLTQYSWTLKISDDVQSIQETFTFTTAAIEPIISNPQPADGEIEVPITLPELQFTLKDYQGDTMEYTVQTSPNIGSDHKVGVHDGTYAVPISGMKSGSAYRWFVNVTDGTHWTRKIFSFTTETASQFDPFENGWQYRKQITIDHTQVAGYLIKFPVLVSIVDPDLAKAQADGDDILLMNDIGNSTKLHHELEVFDQATGTLAVWVNIPAVSSEEDTLFYLYYGNPSCINQEYPEKVWDSNYVSVWHMDDATPNSIAESTVHHYTGTKMAPDEPQEIPGKIGSSQNFDGTNDNIWIDGQSVLGIGEKTVSFWMKRDLNDEFQTVLTNALGGTYNNAGLDIAVNPPLDLIEMAVGNGVESGHYLFLKDAVLPDTTDYYYYVFTQHESNLSIYLDGALYGWTTETEGSESAPSHNLSIGRSHQNPPYYYWFDGRLDELRMSTLARSAEWIQTEYANQNSPWTFVSLGPEVPGP